MPLYEYFCQGCGKRFDKIAPTMSADAAHRSCPDCGANADRQISVVQLPWYPIKSVRVNGEEVV